MLFQVQMLFVVKSYEQIHRWSKMQTYLTVKRMLLRILTPVFLTLSKRAVSVYTARFNTKALHFSHKVRTNSHYFPIQCEVICISDGSKLGHAVA